MRRLFLALAAALLSVLVLVRAADPLPVQQIREAYFDLLQRIQPRAPVDLPVRVVDVDEASLAEIGQWPWPRDVLAALTLSLADLGAATVAYDMLFSESDRMSPARLLQQRRVAEALGGAVSPDRLARLDNDLAFAAALTEIPTTLGIARTTGEAGVPVEGRTGFVEVGAGPRAGLYPMLRGTPLVPELAEEAAGTGGINVSPSARDGIVREVPLVWRADAGVLPSLALDALRIALGETTLVLLGSPAAEGVTEAVRVGGYEVPTNARGALRVRYRRDDPSLYVSAADLLDPGRAEALRPAIEGHIVLVGTSAAGLLDIRTTALGERVPGVSIHAQILEQILLDDYLRRSDAIEGLEIGALVVLGLLVAGTMAFAGPVASLVAGGIAGAGTLAASWLAFDRMGILFDATYPLIGGFLAFSLLAMFQFVVADREKRMIRKSFARYVAPGVLDEIEARGHQMELGGEMRDVTVMFSDVRNFTALSETMSAHDVVAMLNDVFSDLSEEILAARGTIDKFIGDEIMAFWNAPLETPDHQRQACLAALAMRRRLRLLSNARTAAGRNPVEMAVGLATGPACIGNIGSRDRFNYTAIGETVNVAARTQAACRHVGYDILVTDEVARAAADLAFLPAGALDFKGVSQRRPVHLLVGGVAIRGGSLFSELQRAHANALSSLAEGGAIPAAQLLACRQAAAEVEPGLAQVYARLAARAEDFARPARATAQGV